MSEKLAGRLKQLALGRVAGKLPGLFVAENRGAVNAKVAGALLGGDARRQLFLQQPVQAGSGASRAVRHHQFNAAAFGGVEMPAQLVRRLAAHALHQPVPLDGAGREILPRPAATLGNRQRGGQARDIGYFGENAGEVGVAGGHGRLPCEMFHARFDAINATPYDTAFDERADNMLMHLGSNDDFTDWDQGGDGAFRVLFERLMLTEVVMAAILVKKTPVITRIPLGMSEHQQAVALLLMYLLGPSRVIDRAILPARPPGHLRPLN